LECVTEYTSMMELHVTFNAEKILRLSIEFRGFEHEFVCLWHSLVINTLLNVIELEVALTKPHFLLLDSVVFKSSIILNLLMKTE
jgi:hypothetical protein